MDFFLDEEEEEEDMLRAVEKEWGRRRWDPRGCCRWRFRASLETRELNPSFSSFSHPLSSQNPTSWPDYLRKFWNGSSTTTFAETTSFTFPRTTSFSSLLLEGSPPSSSSQTDSANSSSLHFTTPSTSMSSFIGRSYSRRDLASWTEKGRKQS